MNNVVLSIFIKCCSGCPGRHLCDNPNPDSFANYSLSYCAYPSNCTVPGPCTLKGQDSCFVDRTDIWRSGVNLTIPSYSIDSMICRDLQTLSVHGVTLVGPAILGSCGGGSPAAFRSSLAILVSNESVPFFSLYLTVALIQMGILFLSLYLFSSASASYYLQFRIPVAKAVRVDFAASEVHDAPPQSASPTSYVVERDDDAVLAVPTPVLHSYPDKEEGGTRQAVDVVGLA